MTHVLSQSSPLANFRRAAARMWEDPDSRSILIGILGVFLVHLLLFATAPYLLRTEPSQALANKQATTRQFNIQITPNEFVKPQVKPPPLNKFVEPNPNAPDNVPDKTNNFSSKNSQLAQEKPQLDQHNDTPQLDGKKDIQSNQVVSGQLTKPPVDSPPPSPQAALPTKTEMAPRQQQNPLSGFVKDKDNDDAFGSNVGKVPDAAKPVPEVVQGAAKGIASGQSQEMAIDPKHPRARPILEQTQTRPAIFKDNQFGTSNIGPVSYSAKWSSYGAYLHKMIEAIQAQWDRILIDSNTEPPSGSSVTVTFVLDSKGRISEIKRVESTSSEQGKGSCIGAITNTAPYGEWTDDMKAVLGDSQELTFVFYYE
jgi:hypothetical protein